MRKTLSIQNLLSETSKRIIQDQASWKDYLGFSARLYKYPFKDQILIYAQRPDATAVADINVWNKSMHCWVKRGSRGIALLDDTRGRTQLRYVFDEKDVREIDGSGRKPRLWELKPDIESNVIENLSEKYGITKEDTLYEQLMGLGEQLAGGASATAYSDLAVVSPGNSLDTEFKIQFQDTLTKSIQYVLIKRCELPITDEAYFTFPFIQQFNTLPVLSILGSYNSQLCQPVLSEIGKVIFQKEKEIALKQQVHYNTLKREIIADMLVREESNKHEQENQRSIKLYSERGLSDSGSEHGTNQRERSIGSESGVRPDEERLSERRSANALRQSAGIKSADTTSVTDSRTGRTADGKNDKPIARERERGRSIQGKEPDFMGSKNESIQAGSNGSSNRGDYTQLSFFPNAAVSRTTDIADEPLFDVPVSVSDSVIKDILLTGSTYDHSCLRIIDHDPKHSSLEEHVDFLKMGIQESEINPTENHNYRLAGQDQEYTHFSPKERYQANIDAIKLLQQVEADNRSATPNEKTVLSKYAGWGGISEVFDSTKESWKKEYEELKSLLPKEQYDAAKASTLNAHYTSPQIIKFMYQVVIDCGIKADKILEPAVGSGNFIGAVPEEWKNSSFYCTELDSVTGRIAKLLYPDAQIEVKGFEESVWQDNSMDLAIGNVPFGQYQVYDKRYVKESFEIHDYFFAKSIDLVKPGGIVAFITSKGTMDKKNAAVREYIAKRAELITAVRLPNTAFKAQAGTSVTSDILFFQKREKIFENVLDEDWLKSEACLQDYKVNRYFIDHPEMVLGELKIVSGQYGMEIACLPVPESSLSQQMDQVRGYIKGQLTLSDERLKTKKIKLNDPISTNTVTSPRPKQVIQPLDRTELFYELSQCARNLIDFQLANCSDEELKEHQTELNKLYDIFVQKFGLVSSKSNSRYFSSEDSYYLLCSLEILNEDGTLKRKSDIFTARTIQVQHVPSEVETANEALAISLDQKGKIDLDYMSELCSKVPKEITKDLTGVIFKNPINKTWETADEYLSGNVRSKLEIAKDYVEEHPEYAANVQALQQVQPKDLAAAEIEIRLGATWIEPKYILDFIKDTFVPRQQYLNYNLIDVSYSDTTGQWYIKGKNIHDSVISNVTFGTKRANAYKLLELALNLKDVQIFDTVEVDGKETKVLNSKETVLASQKQDLIKERFKEWIFKDPERRETLCKLYNEKFNSIRPREFEGSHLSFPGMSPLIKLRQHQKNGVARNLYGKNTLYAHCVGAGKTFTMTAAAMESKRIGLCNKSLFVVPNHLIGQWAKEVLILYPGANILASTKKDFEPANRKKFCSRIATSNYDIVIIGHSQFEKIPISKESQEKTIRNQLEVITEEIEQMQIKGEERFTVKQLEKTRKTLDVRLKKLNDLVQDSVVTFEQLGVDRLFVDESHHYKNLFLYTKMRNVAGISQTEALKSTDMYNKCQYIDEITGGTGITFATGTPISNSMTELYTNMRYLQSETLNRLHLNHFDSWASTFGETITATELAPEGTGYRLKTRFAKFFNLPELMSIFKECADIQTADILKLPVPEAAYHNVAVKPSEFQQDMLLDLAARADGVRNGGVEPWIDNMLKITNDGRKLALDQRTIDPTLPRAENAKSVECCNNIHDIWERTSAAKSTQLVFCDLSTPSAKNNEESQFKNIYEDLKQQLIEKGIPEKQIAFIHDANTDQRKSQLFAKVRTGEVRVLLGSTSKMGAGTNVQDKLIAIHRLDVPWRPSDIEQSEGRGIRQGNENEKVHIYRYVTEGTFDSYSWQLIENKQKFISQIMTSKSPLRACEDIDEAALSYAEVKALATGNLHIKEKMDLDIEVSKLKMLLANDKNMKYQLEDQINKEYPQDISLLKERIAGIEKDLSFIRSQTVLNSEFFEANLKGVIYTDKKEAGIVLNEICKGMEGKIQSDPIRIGSYQGFDLFYKYESFWGKQSLIFKHRMKYEIPVLEGSRSFTRFHQKFDTEIDKEIAELKSKLGDKLEQLENAKKELKKPFPYKRELKEKTERLVRLDLLLSQDKDEMKRKVIRQQNINREAGIEVC